MSNGFTQNITFTHLWRGRSPGANEFNTLLNLLPSPALVIDPRANEILAANSEFLKLTAYSLADLTKTELSALFPGISRFELVQAGEHQAGLKRHARDEIEVITRSSALDQSSNRVLLSILPLESFIKQKEDLNNQEILFKAIEGLFCLTSLSDIESAVDQALQVSRSLISGKVICVYQTDNQLSQYNKIGTTENLDIPIFPSVAASEVSIESGTFDLWVPGKRVVSDFHRIARVANLPYVALFPLILDGTQLGLLVIADTDTLPEDQFEIKGKIIASGLSAILYHFVLVQNLNRSLNQYVRSLAIRDTVMDNAMEGNHPCS